MAVDTAWHGFLNNNSGLQILRNRYDVHNAAHIMTKLLRFYGGDEISK